MNALQITATGALENLRNARVAKPVLKTGEALIRVKAAGVNSSDAANVLGWMPGTPPLRIPGRDFAGEVVEASDPAANDWVGAEVWGTGGARGFAEDGTFAEYLKVPIAGLSRKPRTLDNARAASISLPWLCAWITTVTLGKVEAGQNVVIIGVNGAIGAAAAQLCKARGAASIFGTYRSPPTTPVPPYITPIVLSTSESPHPIRTELEKYGLLNKVDVLLDCAGYEDPFNDALGAMNDSGSGRVVVMAVHRKDGMFQVDLRTLYMRALKLLGMKSSMLSQPEVKEVLDYVAGKFDRGEFTVEGKVAEVSMWDEEKVREALDKVLKGTAGGRTVFVP
ncbi:GroES-like protein [Dentipellis sp. KUC8613]|nr:GroES-like protein [Dentipellis sp. KUC8613]